MLQSTRAMRGIASKLSGFKQRIRRLSGFGRRLSGRSRNNLPSLIHPQPSLFGYGYESPSHRYSRGMSTVRGRESFLGEDAEFQRTMWLVRAQDHRSCIVQKPSLGRIGHLEPPKSRYIYASKPWSRYKNKQSRLYPKQVPNGTHARSWDDPLGYSES